MKLYEQQIRQYLKEGLSSHDISVVTGINARTIRWYYKKYRLVDVPQFKKDHKVWNKGLKAEDNEKIKCSTEKAHAALRGTIAWNSGKRMEPLTDKHKNKISEALKGKYIGVLSSNWRGGTTSKNKLLRKSGAFKEWRKSVFERDNYTCQNCNERGSELHPHHIKSFADFPVLRFDIDNGQTLCKQCHLKTDTWGVRKARAALATW